MAEVGLDAMLHYESGSSKLLDDTLIMNYALLSLKQTWKWHPHLCTFNFADNKLFKPHGFTELRAVSILLENQCQRVNASVARA